MLRITIAATLLLELIHSDGFVILDRPILFFTKIVCSAEHIRRDGLILVLNENVLEDKVVGLVYRLVINVQNDRLSVLVRYWVQLLRISLRILINHRPTRFCDKFTKVILVQQLARIGAALLLILTVVGRSWSLSICSLVRKLVHIAWSCILIIGEIITHSWTELSSLLWLKPISIICVYLRKSTEWALWWGGVILMILRHKRATLLLIITSCEERSVCEWGYKRVVWVILLHKGSLGLLLRLVRGSRRSRTCASKIKHLITICEFLF